MRKKNNSVKVAPNERLGIIGGGQLGRMIVIAATRLGIKSVVFSDVEDCPARLVADEFICGSYQDAVLLDDFSRKCAVITYEFENIPLAVVDYLASRTSLYPSRDILAVTQDRLAEKSFLKAIGIPVPNFGAVSHEGDIKARLKDSGRSGILKTRKAGYDGKGQAMVATPKHAVMAYYDIKEVPAIIEDKIDFKQEFSVIGVRTLQGEFYHYDITENVHENGVLKTSIVPANLPLDIQAQALAYTKSIAHHLNYVGVLAVEYFLTQDNQILANEIAPRVHNSGHWTIDACYFDQFEQHVRAICGWQLGNMVRHSNAVMTNLIGGDVEKWEEYVANNNTVLHLYGKSEIREGRKMGHVTKLAQKI